MDSRHSISTIMRRVRIALLMADEINRGDRDPAGHGNYAPPFRMRMRDGELGPEYGPVDWPTAWKRWRSTAREAGALWDPPAPPPKPEPPQPPPWLTPGEFLERHGHELDGAVAAVAVLRLTTRLLDAGVARRLAMRPEAAAAHWRTFTTAWLAHNDRLAARHAARQGA